MTLRRILECGTEAIEAGRGLLGDRVSMGASDTLSASDDRGETSEPAWADGR